MARKTRRDKLGVLAMFFASLTMRANSNGFTRIYFSRYARFFVARRRGKKRTKIIEDHHRMVARRMRELSKIQPKEWAPAEVMMMDYVGGYIDDPTFFIMKRRSRKTDTIWRLENRARRRLKTRQL